MGAALSADRTRPARDQTVILPKSKIREEITPTHPRRFVLGEWYPRRVPMWLKTIALAAACAAKFAAAFGLIGVGGAVLSSSLQPAAAPNVVFGILPVVAGIWLTFHALRSLAQMFSRRLTRWSIGPAFAIAAAIFDLAAFSSYRQFVDNSITVEWNPVYGTFSWGKGAVQLPSGFKYERDQGMDTLMGHFTSADGTLVVQHDIGEFAGEHNTTRGTESITEGARIKRRRATRTDATGQSRTFAQVSFPDSGCATFHLDSPNENAAATIEFIAHTYRPTDWKPAWLRPMLPELLRSDCRAGFSFPFD